MVIDVDRRLRFLIPAVSALLCVAIPALAAPAVKFVMPNPVPACGRLTVLGSGFSGTVRAFIMSRKKSGQLISLYTGPAKNGKSLSFPLPAETKPGDYDFFVENEAGEKSGAVGLQVAPCAGADSGESAGGSYYCENKGPLKIHFTYKSSGPGISETGEGWVKIDAQGRKWALSKAEHTESKGRSLPYTKTFLNQSDPAMQMYFQSADEHKVLNCQLGKPPKAFNSAVLADSTSGLVLPYPGASKKANLMGKGTADWSDLPQKTVHGMACSEISFNVGRVTMYQCLSKKYCAFIAHGNALGKSEVTSIDTQSDFPDSVFDVGVSPAECSGRAP